MNKHLDWLGQKVRDRVTGAEGVVTSVCFDLYGCIQADINRGFGDDGKPKQSFWFDVKRLERIGDAPVMPRPNFETIAQGAENGPAEKASPAF